MSEPPIQAMPGFSLAAFRPDHQGPDRRPGRAAIFILTMVAHLGLLAAFLFGVRVAAPAILDAKPLAVSIEKQVMPPPPVLAMKPKLILPDAIHVPVPEFTIQSQPSPVLATFSPSATAGAGKSEAGTGTATAIATGCASCYVAAVHNYLVPFRNYPIEAQVRHLQGVVIIHFVSDRAGNLISFEVAKSSGYQILDDAALAMMRRARKIPPVPADLNVPGLNSNIPITFTDLSAESSDPSFGNGRFSR